MQRSKNKMRKCTKINLKFKKRNGKIDFEKNKKNSRFNDEGNKLLLIFFLLFRKLFVCEYMFGCLQSIHLINMRLLSVVVAMVKVVFVFSFITFF